MMLPNFVLILPFMILVCGAFSIYLLSRFLKLSNKTESVLTCILLLSVIGALIYQTNERPLNIHAGEAPSQLLVNQGIKTTIPYIGVFTILTACTIAIFITLYSGEYLSKDPRYLLYYPLVLLLIAGIWGMFYSTDLFLIFLSAELTTITASGLTAFRFNQEAAVKAGFKYLIMNSLGALIMFLGIYFVFRSTGSLNFSQISGSQGTILNIGAGCIIVGFAIKAGVVPLHTWVPEVYTNAPSAISGLFSGVVSKSMLLVLPSIVLILNVSPHQVGVLLILLSIGNMIVGAIQMLIQTNLKSFLAYAAITHTGYLMFILGIGYFSQLPISMIAALFSFLTTAMTMCVGYLSLGIYGHYYHLFEKENLYHISTLSPFNTICFAITLAGLAGIPLFAGFIGKWLIYSTAIAVGGPLVLIGFILFLITSIIALIGYLTVIIRQYYAPRKIQLTQSTKEQEQPLATWLQVPIGTLTLLIILLGIFPSPVLTLIELIVNRIPAL